MKTCLDCIPCLFKQALEASRIAGADTETQRQILNRAAAALPGFSLEASPPEMARTIYKLVRELTRKDDPYDQIKEKSNRLALGMYDWIQGKLEENQERLLTAVELAIAGNIIDYGAKNTLDVDEELRKILAREQKVIRNEAPRFFDYGAFAAALQKAGIILYLADNAGEVVFDRVLLEEIKRLYPEKEIVFAVKDKPAINDAMLKDAVDCGIDRVSRVISSGSDAPGTLLPLCSESFLRLFEKADMVISKGQGNFETLSDAGRPIFFLLMAKCPVIANHIGCRVGDVILHHKNEIRK